jgi:hypothetical protein
MYSLSDKFKTKYAVSSPKKENSLKLLDNENRDWAESSLYQFIYIDLI